MIKFKPKSSPHLTKEETSRYIWLEVSKKSDTKEYRDFSERCKKFYGLPKSYVKIGKGILSSWGRDKGINIFTIQEGSKIWGEAMDYVWSFLVNLPKRYFTDVLGVGSFGVVLPKGPGKVEKINYRPFLPQETKFYRYLLYHPLQIFPKIYSLGKDRVVMERIETNTQETRELRGYISKYIERIQTNLLPVLKPRWADIERDLGDDHWFPKLLKDIEEGLGTIFGYRAIGDLSPLNVGVRKETKEFVFFDPIGGDILMR